MAMNNYPYNDNFSIFPVVMALRRELWDRRAALYRAALEDMGWQFV